MGLSEDPSSVEEKSLLFLANTKFLLHVFNKLNFNMLKKVSCENAKPFPSI